MTFNPLSPVGSAATRAIDRLPLTKGWVDVEPLLGVRRWVRLVVRDSDSGPQVSLPITDEAKAALLLDLEFQSRREDHPDSRTAGRAMSAIELVKADQVRWVENWFGETVGGVSEVLIEDGEVRSLTLTILTACTYLSDRRSITRLVPAESNTLHPLAFFLTSARRALEANDDVVGFRAVGVSIEQTSSGVRLVLRDHEHRLIVRALEEMMRPERTEERLIRAGDVSALLNKYFDISVTEGRGS